MKPTVKQLRQVNGPDRQRLGGLLRRVAVAASGAFWQLLGFDDGENRETFDDVESFQGIGFASRPRAGKGEALIAHVGADDGHPVVLGMRDPETEPELAADESALFNSKAVVRVTKDGDIIVRGAAGRNVFVDDGSGGVALATKADIDALRNYIQTQLTLPVVGSVAGPVAAPPAPFSAGTSVLRGK